MNASIQFEPGPEFKIKEKIHAVISPHGIKVVFADGTIKYYYGEVGCAIAWVTVERGALPELKNIPISPELIKRYGTNPQHRVGNFIGVHTPIE